MWRRVILLEDTVSMREVLSHERNYNWLQNVIYVNIRRNITVKNNKRCLMVKRYATPNVNGTTSPGIPLNDAVIAEAFACSPPYTFTSVCPVNLYAGFVREQYGTPTLPCKPLMSSIPL